MKPATELITAPIKKTPSGVFFLVGLAATCNIIGLPLAPHTLTSITNYSALRNLLKLPQHPL
ncbi:hypothetical protein RC54_19100 [Herbaspirillum rubrisubalbicans]|uniref:Uncharacterized protein n=1 Tax=Herbaspirillum rubrisubalbicans TaxID=80842 RepID=A0AAD0XGX5_9BURK|nr:hypothetical protein [Herbaspirillum rubrisubalbicans]AYR25791.1 hypothetical protein RC54_19100 [Herbaspirillum rubrisubalbicans]